MTGQMCECGCGRELLPGRRRDGYDITCWKRWQLAGFPVGGPPVARTNAECAELARSAKIAAATPKPPVQAGHRFGRWTTISPASATGRTYVLCRCDCGTEREVTADNLQRGTSRSCGCRVSEFARIRHLPAADRFWEKVNQNGPIPERAAELGSCWLWMAAKDGKGYGQIRVNDRAVLAHIFSYEMARGPVPDGKELDHLCCVKLCVNPAHLEPVTHRENCLRALATRRKKSVA